MREPAEAAEGRRGEERAARGEAGGPQLRGAPVEHGVDAGREGRVLDRDPPVALDEHEQDVLAAQAGQQPVAGRGARSGRGRSRGRAPRESARAARTACTSSTARAAALEEATGAPTTRRATQSTPSTAAARSAQRAVAGRDPRHPQQRQDRDGEEREDEDGRGGGDEVRGRRADRVAQRLDADPHVARVVERA